jgi:pyruvate dehydrogenase E2 component (dihydrolipoamide acetyltransferase)
VTEFKVPELGENIAGGDVMRVMVNPGDTIARDQPVLELETDKATIEVPSTVAGTVKEVRVKKGDKVSVGAVVFTVDEGASGGNGASSSQKAAKTEEKPASQPQKTEAPPAAESKPAADNRPDHKVISMPPRGAPEAPAAAPSPPPAVRADGNGERGPVAPASPAVRRLAREIGVNVDEVQGTGPGGRISQEDVKEHARRILSSVPSTAGAGGAAAGARAARALPDFQKWGEIDRQPLSNIRRVTADHLSYAWNAIPHVTQFDKADVTALEELRKKFKDPIAKAGGNLTVTAMLVRILATAVRKFPQFNASIDTERGELIFKKYVNVGVAVDTDRGLLSTSTSASPSIPIADCSCR